MYKNKLPMLGKCTTFGSVLAIGVLLVATLQRNNTENSKEIFPEKE
jgi:hypothetical protein